MAASIGNVDWLQLCMTTAESHLKADRYGFTVLHMAAIHSRLQCLKLLLEDCGMGVNVPSVYGWRALHLVMNQKSGHRAIPCLRYLLQQGADVNAKSRNLSTPLHRAAGESLEDCISVLVEAGADVHAEASDGNKPIDLCHLCCHRSSARYLRSVMWNRDKEDYVQELKKMEIVRQRIEELEQGDLIKMQQIPFCDSNGNKNLTEKGNNPTKPGPRCTGSSYGQDGQTSSSKKTKEETIGKESSKKVILPKARREQVGNGRTVAKKASWNASTNPQRPPTLYINRAPTLWLCNYPRDETKKDISSNVLLTRDEQGQLQIQTLRGQVFSPPNLPYEVIDRSLFPKRGPQDRIQMAKAFKATHVFEVPRKQQVAESQKLTSEIFFHLRRNLDLKFRKSDRESTP
ncbi:Ankyrin repeat domain-containing protein 53, partial [Pristimantis euphronides]